MKSIKVKLLGKLAVTAIAVMAMSACVEIKSDAKVASDAKVSFSTTYDMSKILPTLQQMSKDGGDVAKSLSCDKMNEKLTKELKCKDIAPGKFVVTGEFAGGPANGVNLDKDKNQLSVDAVQLFKTVADLNPAKGDGKDDATDPASKMMQAGLVPVAQDQAATYKQMGMALSMNVTMPAEVLTVDGAAAKDIKENTVAVNFIEVAGKDSFVITSKVSASRIIWKILFILLAIALIAAAILYLLKRKKSSPNSPAPKSAPVAAESATDIGSDSVPEVVTQVKSEVADVQAQAKDAVHDASDTIAKLDESKPVDGNESNDSSPKV